MRQKFLNFITLKGFSKATIRTYLSLFDIIISDDENIFNKSEDEIISYLAKKIQVNDYSDSYVAQYVSVFNIVIRDILKREDKIKIPRPKKAQKQPDILSVEEVKSILDNIENIKHKTIVALMYSTGLRVSEACNLKIKDIDSKNNFISIRNGKGKVDRKVILDDSILILLREYYSIYTPNIYLFNGSKGEEYSVRSSKTLLRMLLKAGINKNISSHSLRHSCFTQLVKNGVDIRYIQNLRVIRIFQQRQIIFKYQMMMY